MNTLNTKWPIDIVLCLLWSFILIPISLLNIEGYLRVVLGIPFVFFIPGYLLIYALFPAHTIEQNMDVIERLALSIGFSIALVPLISLILNYTFWGIRLESVLLSIFIFILCIGGIALYRWFLTNQNKRLMISFRFSLLKSKNKLDFILNIILIMSIITSLVIPIYIIITPKTGEKFTGFYLVGVDENPEKYSTNLTQDVNTSRLIEILNHEYKTINYVIELWLINYTQVYNESINQIEYTPINMWFIKKISAPPINHTNIDIGTADSYSWRDNISFAIHRSGSFKLTFLLFTTPTNLYNQDEDYINIAQQKMNKAYREIHQWITVNFHTPPKADFTTSTIKKINQPIYFTSNCTSTDSRIINWTWSFGEDKIISYGDTIALGFDGIDDYVDCGYNLSMQPVNGTLETWIFPKEFSGIQIIFTSSSDYEYRHPNFRLIDNFLRLDLTNNTNQEQHTYYANFILYTWYHIAVTWDGLNVRFYVNGILQETQIQNITPAGNTAPKRIGALAPPIWPETFNGTLKDMRIYDRSLDIIELQQNYNGNVVYNGLVSWWKMNDGGNTIYDITGRNNGTIYGANWINQASYRFTQPGSYNVQLTIEDEYGQIDSISKIIVIT